MPFSRSSRSTISKEYKCTVQLLDDSQTIVVEFKKDDVGQVVLDYVCDMLNVAEKDYFGLRYVDVNRQRYWLDSTKPILRQIKSGTPIVFAFRVKYYPADPSVLHEQLTRYLVTSQLQRDLLHGRLYCPQNDAALLGAYIIQAELGDYDPEEHKGNYVSQFKMFLNQTPRLEEKIMIEHQNLKGKDIVPAVADLGFLKKACALDTYGYYPFTIKDAKNGQVYVGATPNGLLIYQAHKKLHHLKWNDIQGFDYSGKEFFIYPTEDYFNQHNLDEENAVETDLETTNGVTQGASDHKKQELSLNKNGNKKKPTLRFICPSPVFCKHLWKYMLAEQTFFTKDRAGEVKPIVLRRGPMFRRATFRYSGRVLKEIKEDALPKRAEPAFERVHAQRQLPRDERNAPWANKFHTLPRSIKTVPEEQSPQILSKTVDSTYIRDSLVISSSDATPSTTPASGLSPVENGPWKKPSVGNGPSEQSISIVETTSTITGRVGYQSEVITESQRHVEVSAVQPVPVPVVEQRNASDGVVQKANGQPVVNGGTSKQLASNSQTSGSGRAFVNSIITTLIFLVLILATIVVVMEVQDAEFRAYVRRVTGDDAFRRQVYDPVRQRFVDTYGRIFH